MVATPLAGVGRGRARATERPPRARRAKRPSLLIVWALAVASPALAHPPLDRQIDDVTRRIAETPGDAGLYLQRGELRRIHREWELATADYEAGRRLDPALARVDLCQGKMLIEAGRPAEALPLLDRFLVTETDHPGALVLRGRARAAVGDPLDAARDFSRAIARFLEAGRRPSPDIYIDRARALVAAGGAHRDEALAGLEAGLEVLGHPVTLDLEALAIETALGRTEAALRRIDRLAAGSPRKESWLIRRAEILEREGRLAEARRDYESALAAIAALPAGRRGAGAVGRLERKARSALERLGSLDEVNDG